MKPLRLPLLALCAAALLLAACAAAGIASEDGAGPGRYTFSLILDGEHDLTPNEHLTAALLITGGRLRLEPGARLTGPVFVVSGLLENQGEIRGDLTLAGGRLVLGPGSRLEGDLNLAGGSLAQDPAALVTGAVNQAARVPPSPTRLFETGLNRVLSLLAQALIVSALAYVYMRVIPRPVARIARALTGHPLVSLALGLLAFIVALVLLVVMIYTLILIPVSLLGGLLLILLAALGWTAFGYALGRPLSRVLPRRFSRRLTPAAATALGALLFQLLIAALSLFRFGGGLLALLTAAAGLGAVLLTRFGAQEFTPAPLDDYAG